ncbi:MAG TPA: PAS domain-containing protein [Anaeromyxobacter sp.]
MPRTTPVPRTPVPRASPAARPLGAVAFDAHPIPTLVLDARLRVVVANASARRLFGATEGTPLGNALGCIDARSPGGCGSTDRCGGCAFRRAAERAIAGERTRERGFVIRGDQAERPGDAHLLAAAVPLRHEGQPFAILALNDVNAVLGDPDVVRICDGCGRVQDDDGAWHPLHRYLEDHLGIGDTGPLCGDCAAGLPRGPSRRPPT